jgi:LysR family transcriptional activator of nhaA
MAHLNYKHLRYFWTIVQEGGLTKAAERLHVSPSALSVQLQKLEAELGHPLFERRGRGLKLTEAGRIALDYAGTVFKAGDELVSTLTGIGPENRQVLRVGALATLSRNFQIGFLRPLLDNPEIELVVRSGTLRELLPQLEALTLDIVLSNVPVQRDADTEWQNVLVDEQPVSLVGHPEAVDRATFSFPASLKTTPILLPSLASSIRVAFDQLMDEAGVRPLILAEVDDMAMLRLMARESRGVALVPPVVVTDELESGILIEICTVPPISETFFAITLRRRFPNPLTRTLIDRARARAKSDSAPHSPEG